MTELEQIKKEYKQTEKEYAELKIKNHDYAIWATDKIAKLEAQIEKMKNCKNCVYSLYGGRGENGRCESCGNKDEWELAE